MTVFVYALQPHMLQAIDESSAVGTLQELSIKQAKKEKANKSILILRRQIHFTIPTSSPLNQRERSNNAITLTVLCRKIIRTIKSRHFLSCIAFPSKKIFLSFDLQKPSCHQESGIGNKYFMQPTQSLAIITDSQFPGCCASPLIINI